MNNQQLTGIFSKPLVALGLMSGTSLDGIDVAIIKTDGEIITEFGAFITVPYKDKLRDRIRAEINNAKNFADDSKGLQEYFTNVKDANLERDITLAHAEAVESLVKGTGVKPDIIGFHGQTVIHKPNLPVERAFTWQMGDGKLLAERTKTTVVYDFRSSDVKARGQGAPLVPVFHRAITWNLNRPVAVVNIGGVANITWVQEDGEMLAFDTGPGNAMINDIMKKHFGKEFDDGGAVADKGKVDEKILAEYLADEYFTAKPPKSLDRNHFTLDKVAHLKPEDAVATLTAFTAHSILLSNKYFNKKAKFYITGGGRLNHKIMTLLGDDAEPIENIGHNGDAFEAQAFAYLAVRAHNGLPISFPTTTGCKESPIRDIAKIEIY